MHLLSTTNNIAGPTLEHCSLFKPKLPTGDTGLFSSPSLCTHGEPRTPDPCLEHALTYAATTDQLDGSFDYNRTERWRERSVFGEIERWGIGEEDEMVRVMRGGEERGRRKMCL